MPAVANSRVLLAALLVSITAPAAAQQPTDLLPPAGAPKSLLPDDLETPPAPTPGAVEGALPQPDAAPAAGRGFEPLPPEAALAGPADVPPLEEPDPLALLAGPIADPAFAGTLTPATTGYGPDLFLGSDSRFLAALLDRIDAPLASRWAQIMLQRALLSRAYAPPPLNPADWLASRGAALIAMGAAADAHRMVSAVAVDRYTWKLYGVAAQAALASADPIGLCPLAPTARLLTDMPTWMLADAMCLSVLGDELGATSLFDRARRNARVNGFDIGLAERVASAAGGGRRGANPEWQDMQGLTAWRIGLASAAGLDLPDAAVAGATPVQKAWLVRLPGLGVSRRAALAPAAAATGAISSQELGRILAAEAAALDPSQAGDSAGGRLRAAQILASPADRLAAMKSLWSRAAPGTADHYGWLLATAPAAARLPPSADLAADAPAVAQSLVAAGITGPAVAWWRATGEAGDAARSALWAQLIALSAVIPMESASYDQWARGAPPHRAALLAAGLAGLGRGRIGPPVAVISNEWTAALDRAVANRRIGEVMLLAATGLQGRWAEVPADYLRRIAAALTAVGHAAEARLIVAEAAGGRD